MSFTIFDGHNDALLRYVREEGYDFLKHNEGGHLDLPRAKKGNFGGGFFAIFVPNPPEPIDLEQFITETGYDFPLPDAIDINYAQPIMTTLAGRLFQIEARSDGQFKVVRMVDELTDCLQNDVIAAILHVEGAEMIDPELHTLEFFYQAGLRSIGPVWSRPNAFAHGVPMRFPHLPDTGPGLTDAGKALIRECNRLGILIDLSHMNEQGFWDVAALSDAPLVATHSNVHALCPTTRNLTDKQLAAIKDSDGMVGLNFAVGFLNAHGHRDKDLPFEVMIRHLDYLIEKLGVERVGFGSDFDGAGVTNEMTDAASLPKFIAALQAAGYDDDMLRKITHENWVRVLRKTWKDA